MQGIITSTFTGRLEDNVPYRWSFYWLEGELTFYLKGVTPTGTFTDRSTLDGPFRIPFCVTLRVTENAEFPNSNFDTHFEVWGITD